jgi:hypothetical protein
MGTETVIQNIMVRIRNNSHHHQIFEHKLLCGKFKEKLPEPPKAKAEYEIIEGAGHAPFVEWTALAYEKLSTFLMKDNNMKYSDMY